MSQIGVGMDTRMSTAARVTRMVITLIENTPDLTPQQKLAIRKRLRLPTGRPRKHPPKRKHLYDVSAPQPKKSRSEILPCCGHSKEAHKSDDGHCYATRRGIYICDCTGEQKA